MKSRMLTMICTLLCISFASPLIAADFNIWDEEFDGHYETETADGLTLKMMRYRPPFNGSEFNEGKQPILLFPAIVCNMNEYMAQTPVGFEDKYDFNDIPLVDGLPAWAEDDAYIEQDQMLVFSMAYYFWKMGLDPWFANYRGVGRGQQRSDRLDESTLFNTKGLFFEEDVVNLDMWGTLDPEAAIQQVYQETGQFPFIGGHSTGGLACYVYLQGNYFIKPILDENGVLQGYDEKDKNRFADYINWGFVPHVKQDDEIARKRNMNIPGFIAIDPAVTPPLPQYLNQDILWPALGAPINIDVDFLIGEVVSEIIGPKALITIEDVVFKSIFALDKFFDGMDDTGIDVIDDNLFGYLTCWDMDNTHPFAMDFFTRFGLSNTYLRGFSQYIDFGLNGVLREHYKNGFFNRFKSKPSPLGDNDGYTYYFRDDIADNPMSRVDVPMAALLSSHDSLVSADTVHHQLFNGKTPYESDRSIILVPSGHVDVPIGNNTILEGYDFLGDFINEIMEQ